MSNTLEKHLIQKGESIKTAFEKLNQLSSDSILFVVDINNKLLGSLTDGDIRRGLLKGLSLR
jgi:CBS domain-containing protein